MFVLEAIIILCTVLHFAFTANTVKSPGTTYAELERLNATCSPKDTCSPFPLKQNDTLEHRLCECGSHCTKYKTCCVDSPYLHSYGRLKGRRPESQRCFDVPGTKESYFMVSSCLHRWYGSSDIKKRCEEQVPDDRDPFILAPAMHNEITYKNYFCALCHGANPGEIRLWNISVTKTVRQHADENVKRALIDKLVFDDSTGQWGVEEGVDGSMNFVRVDIGFVPKEDMKGSVRPCMPDLISDCDPEWKDEAVREKCRLYMAAIYVLSQPKDSSFPIMLRYRNVHCALCNFAELDAQRECKEEVFFALGRPPLSFTLLLDVNPSDGDTVGKINRCKKGEAYDPFFKKCRTLVCALPGYTMEGDRCVKA